MKIGTYEIDLRSAAIGALAVWIACSMFGGSGDGAASTVAKASTGHWYDFGNGMVNLDRVNLITTSVTYDNYGGPFRITDEGCNEAIEWFVKMSKRTPSLLTKPHENTQIKAHIEFDDFTLNLASYDVQDKNDIKKAFRSWMKTLAEIKKAQK